MQANQSSGSQGLTPMPTTDLTQAQCQQLIAFLSSKIQVVAESIPISQKQEPNVSCFNGINSLSNSFSQILSTDWVMDTGTTHHICSTLALFHSYTPVSSTFTLPNNISITVTHKGRVHLSHGLTLDDVLYVPYFQFNLLSISSLTRQHQCTVSFMTDSCHIQDISRTKVIGMGKQVGNLYLFINSTAPATVCNVSLNKTAIWHSRLGHPSFTKLTVIDNELHFNPVNEDITHCSICHLSKQKRLPFSIE